MVNYVIYFSQFHDINMCSWINLFKAFIKLSSDKKMSFNIVFFLIFSEKIKKLF